MCPRPRSPRTRATPGPTAATPPPSSPTATGAGSADTPAPEPSTTSPASATGHQASPASTTSPTSDQPTEPDHESPIRARSADGCAIRNANITTSHRNDAHESGKPSDIGYGRIFEARPPARPIDKDATRERAAASKAVRDAVRLLRERGAIRMTRRAAPGVNTDYSLNLFDGTGDAHRTASPVDNPAPPAGNGGRSPSPTVDGKRRNGGRSAFATVDAHRTPKEKEEEQDLPQERQGDLRTKPEVGGDPGSVDNPGSQPSEEGGAAQLALLARGGDDHNVCPECGVLLDPDRRCGHRTCPRYGSRP